MSKLRVGFRNFVNAPNQEKRKRSERGNKNTIFVICWEVLEQGLLGFRNVFVNVSQYLIIIIIIIIVVVVQVSQYRIIIIIIIIVVVQVSQYRIIIIIVVVVQVSQYRIIIIIIVQVSQYRIIIIIIVQVSQYRIIIIIIIIQVSQYRIIIIIIIIVVQVLPTNKIDNPLTHTQSERVTNTRPMGLTSHSQGLSHSIPSQQKFTALEYLNENEGQTSQFKTSEVPSRPNEDKAQKSQSHT